MTLILIVKKITIELLIMFGINVFWLFSQMFHVESNYHVLDTQTLVLLVYISTLTTLI